MRFAGFTFTTVLMSLFTTASARAEEPDPAPHTGVTMNAGPSVGFNTDDEATDLGGSHGYLVLQGGYRFSFGTEAFALAGAGAGGHESTLFTYGVGLRQHVVLGHGLEPYVETALVFVGDEADTPLALSVGGGVDLRVSSRLSIGLAGGHHFSDDSDEQGAMDWYARAYLRWDL
jgi:opacity protein-like surface antigen